MLIQKMIMKRGLLCAAVLLSMLGGPIPSAQAFLAGSMHKLPFGSRTGLMGGAGVAQGDDDALLLINPAGLVYVSSKTLSLSLNAYGIESWTINNFYDDQNQPPGTEWDGTATSTSLVAAPTSLSFFLGFGAPVGEPWHQSIALGLFTPRADEGSFVAEYRSSGYPEELLMSWEYDYVLQHRLLGLSYGLGLPYGLSVGLSLLGHSYSFHGREDTQSHYYDPRFSDQYAVLTLINEDHGHLALSAVLGIQWRSQWVTAGLSVGTPRISVSANGTSRIRQSMVSGSGGSYTGYMGVDHYELEESADDSGIDINAGLALLIGKRATIELSGFYRHLPEESVSEYSFDSLLADGAEVSRLEDTTQFTTPLRSALGAALGAEVYLDDVPVTLGLFFQQSLRRTETEEEPISGREYNCYGFTLGSGLGRGKLATRFGLRYSLAQGERVGWDIGMQNRAWATTAELRDLRRHLVLAVMSGTISFGEDMGGAL